MTGKRLYQVGEAGLPPDHRAFFNFPTITLGEIKQTIRESFGEDFSSFKDAIAVGAVLNAKNEIRGELVMVGGDKAYCIEPPDEAHPRGRRTEITDQDRIGFFQLAHFAPQEQSYRFEVNSIDELKDKLLQALPGQEAFAVEVRGTFPEITFRSLNTEGHTIDPKAPDCCLNGICEAHQRKFEGRNVAATLTGFYSAKGAVAEGVAFDDMLHLHGQSDDEKLGGHLLSFKGPVTVTVRAMPEIGQWMQMTREHAEEAQQPKWVNRIRIPKHMAQHILEMSLGDEKFEKAIQGLIEHSNLHANINAQLQQVMPEDVTEMLGKKVEAAKSKAAHHSSILEVLHEIGQSGQLKNKDLMQAAVSELGALLAAERTKSTEAQKVAKQLRGDSAAERFSTIAKNSQKAADDLLAIQAAFIDLRQSLGISRPAR